MNQIVSQLTFIITAFIALFLGVFIYVRPLVTFEIQKKFYAKINWRIEPISMEKEVRNTKLMGLFLIIFVILASMYFFITN